MAEGGTFDIRHVAAHGARNPKTGEPVQVPAKHNPTYRAGKTLKAKARSLMLLQKAG
ncbi:MAG: HU family DNA-binding protein [Clostridiales bacterium]|nr:HU family DNA-binding protein [Clostridiales bacterium]